MAIDAARLRAAAQAGLNLGLLRLLEARAAAKPIVTGTSFSCRFVGDIDLHIRIEDEAGKVNLNLADAGLIEALLQGLGLDEISSSAAAGAIVAYRTPLEPTEKSNPAGAAATVRKAYPFDSTEELDQIVALDRRVARQMRTLTTLHSDVRGIDPKAASTLLLTLLSRKRAADAHELAGSPTPLHIEPRFFSTSAGRAFAIRSQSVSRGGAAAAEEIIVRVGGARDRTHAVLAWRIVDTSTEQSEAATQLESC